MDRTSNSSNKVNQGFKDPSRLNMNTNTNQTETTSLYVKPQTWGESLIRAIGPQAALRFGKLYNVSQGSQAIGTVKKTEVTVKG